MATETQSLGELQPIGGGDPIPLMKRTLLVGRRESCDIVLRFANVSAHHCQLSVVGGYWYVKDQGSRNGVKVNGSRVTEKRLDPGDELAVAKHKYEISYSPAELGAVGPPPPENLPSEIMSKSLLERAGLNHPGKPLTSGRPTPHDEPKRYNVLDNSAGQIKDPNRIV
ncbi:MAG TPA: FHA domain-containing protein [Pirellulales bacterium]